LSLAKIDAMERESKRKAIYKHLVTPGGECWEFRRSPAFMAIISVLFLTCILMLGFLAVTVLEEAGVGERWVYPLAILLAWFPFELVFLPWDTWFWPWPNCSTTLTVECGGRVCFGKRELCPAGTVQAVCIACKRRRVTDWQAYLELAGGDSVGVPPPYFGDFELGEHARPLGEELAKALGVPLTESA
jgi:hypothetical protein